MNQDQNMMENAQVETARNEAKENAKAKAKAEMEQMKKETLRKISKGTLKLEKPIRASNTDVTELHYDFNKLTGWEFAQALDRDTDGKTSAFRLTQIQALELFAAAAVKETPDVDAEDIRRRIGISDAVKATQIAVVFFNLTSQTADSRITS